MEPRVEWDGKAFHVGLPTESGKTPLEARIVPDITYVVRIREAGSEEWLMGIETPFANMRLTSLRAGATYELEVRAKNQKGEEGPPATTSVTVSARKPEGD